jgi:hypothetical protein
MEARDGLAAAATPPAGSKTWAAPEATASTTQQPEPATGGQDLAGSGRRHLPGRHLAAPARRRPAEPAGKTLPGSRRPRPSAIRTLKPEQRCCSAGQCRCSASLPNESKFSREGAASLPRMLPPHQARDGIALRTARPPSPAAISCWAAQAQPGGAGIPRERQILIASRFDISV